MGCPTGARVVFHFTLKDDHFKNLTRDRLHVHRFIIFQNSRLPVNRTLLKKKACWKFWTYFMYYLAL